MTDSEGEALDLERARAERRALLAVKASQPFDGVSEGHLIRIPALLAAELRFVLRQPISKAGGMNPSGLADSGRHMLLGSVVDVCKARAEAGLTTTSIADLGSLDTITAVQAKIRPSSPKQIVGSWGPIRGGMLLADVRKLVVFRHGTCRPEIGRQQREWSAEPKRSKDHRVATPDEYVATGYVLGAIARILKEDGRVLGKTLERNAAMLALNANAHGRLSDLHRIDVGHIRFRTVKRKQVMSVRLTMTKTGRTRLVRIHDSRVIDLVTPLLGNDDEAPLFQADGKRLTPAGLAYVLERMGVRTNGQIGGANIMRDSATIRHDGKKARSGPKLGQKGEKTADDHYTASRRKLGLKLLREANDRSASQAAKVRKGNP